MVETESKSINLKKSIIDALHKNPFFNLEISKVDWVAIESLNSFEEIFEKDNVDENIKKLLVTTSNEIFQLVKSRKFQSKKNTWFYKYNFILLLTDPTNLAYQNIKKELIEHFIKLCRKNNEEGITKTYKLILLLIFFAFGAYAILISTVYHKAIFENIYNSDSLNSSSNKSWYELISEVDVQLIKQFPDYSQRRIFTKIALKVSSIFGDKVYLPFKEYAEKSGYNSDPFLDVFEHEDDLLGFSGNLNEEEYQNSSWKKEGSKISWIYKIPELTKEEVDKAIVEFMGIDIQELVISCSLDFSNTKTLDDLDSD
jgi:hypothetical protein